MQTEPKTKLALSILAVAVVMGLIADGLLRGVPWGINLTLWIGCLIAGLFAAKRAGNGTLEFGSAILIAPILVFMVLLGVLVIFASSSTLAPFIYSLF